MVRLIFNFQKMQKQYFENNQCSYCGRKENKDVGTPEWWFGLDDEGDKRCDDCAEALEALEARKKMQAARKKGAENANKAIKAKNPNHYREAAQKRWGK